MCSRGRRVARVAVAYEGRAIVPRQERWLWPSLCSKIRELSRRLWVLKFLVLISGFSRSIEWVN